jgi:CrcB protein
MSAWAIVAALGAGAVGALLRYGLARALASSRAGLPVAVAVVNVLASFVAGCAIALTSPEDPLRLIVVSGFAGGLSTFSTLSVETVQLVLAGRARTAIASVLVNVVAGLAAVALGALVSTWLLAV